MKYLQKTANKVISYRTILILLIIAFSCLLFPMLLIAKYDIPAADDYSFGTPVHDVIKNGGSFSQLIEAAVSRVKEAYYATQGTLCAVFLFSIQPAVFGDQYYVIVPYIMLSMLCIGINSFLTNFFSVFVKHKLYSFLTVVIVMIICSQFLPSPVEGFYWYNGAIYYTFFFGLSLLLFSLLIRLAKADNNKIPLLFIIILLCIIIAFSNLITTLTTFIILASFLLFLLITRNKNRLFFLIPVVIYGICFYINVSAPGFSSRQSLFTSRPGVLRTILLSFQYSASQLYQWNTVPVLALYIFLIPILWKIASESDFSFKLPWLVSLYSFCLQASMNAPTYFAYWDPGPGRVENIRFYAMIILMIINLFYWEGWLGKTLITIPVQKTSGLKVSFLTGIFSLFLIGLILSNDQHPMTSLSAFRSYRRGDAGLYKHIHRLRLEILNDPEIKDALLREFPVKPYVLFFDDITENPAAWQNLDMSEFFHKDSIRLMTHDEFERSTEQ